MRLFKATALTLVAALSVAASTASATDYGQPVYPQPAYPQYGWTAPAPVYPATYHGQAYNNWGHYNNYAWYHVYGVSYHDHLNVRYGPGVGNHVVYTLPYNAQGVQLHDCAVISTSRGPSRWCLVSHQGYVRGWVNARYLAQSH